MFKNYRNSSLTKSLDRMFRPLPIVLSVSLFCASIQAAPVIDFNGSNVWQAQVEDGSKFSSLRYTDENPTGDVTLNLKVGDGTGTIYFEGNSLDKSLIEFWGVKNSVGLNIEGNITISNTKAFKENYVSLINTNTDPIRNQCSNLSISGTLTIEDSSTNGYTVDLWNEIPNNNSNISINEIIFRNVGDSENGGASIRTRADNVAINSINISDSRRGAVFIYGNMIDLGKISITNSSFEGYESINLA